MRKGGVEPPWVSPPDPKSGASANFATFASSTFNHLATVSRPAGGTVADIVAGTCSEPVTRAGHFRSRTCEWCCNIS